ncbi:MAG TPA: hypothetical protein VNG32_02270 [Candidatus Dormibacteraeota bacterium]|nr:hypothetical protein [Candidatus Dormibacteraeota bacterium]
MAETAYAEDQQRLMLGDDAARLQYAGSLSLNDILGAPDSETDLGFETAHVFGVHTDTPSRPVLEVQFGGDPVRGKRFLDLLEAVAPAPFRLMDDRDTVGGILGDWVVYEGEDDRMRKLAAQHSGLKGWTQLGREYSDLWAALEQAAESDRPEPWMLDGNENIIQPEEFLLGWGDASMLAWHGGGPLIETPKLFQLLVDVYSTEEARLQVVHAMKNAAKQSSREGIEVLQGRSAQELFDKFFSLDMESRNQLVNIYDLHSDPKSNGASWPKREEQREKFSALYLKRHCVSFITEDGKTMYAHGIKSEEDIQHAYDSRRLVYVGSDRPQGWARDNRAAFEYELMDVDTVIGRQTAILPGSIKFQETGLVPTVRWTRDENDKRAYQNLPDHPDFTSYRQDVRSGITGLMVLAYLQPEKRARWQTKRRLPGIERTQQMDMAQVPLIALQHARRLIDNELMEQAEELVLS